MWMSMCVWVYKHTYDRVPVCRQPECLPSTLFEAWSLAYDHRVHETGWSWESPVSTSHLKVAALELQVYDLLSSFTGVLEGPNCAP